MAGTAKLEEQDARLGANGVASSDRFGAQKCRQTQSQSRQTAGTQQHPARNSLPEKLVTA
jgi:hypothetical protein